MLSVDFKVVYNNPWKINNMNACFYAILHLTLFVAYEGNKV